MCQLNGVVKMEKHLVEERIIVKIINLTKKISLRILITRQPGDIIRELKQEDFSRRRRGEIRESPGLTSSFSSQI